MGVKKNKKMCKDCGVEIINDASEMFKNGRCYEHFREYKRKKSREFYARHRESEIARHSRYVKENSEVLIQKRKDAWAEIKKQPLQERRDYIWRKNNKDKMRNYWKRAREKALKDDPHFYVKQAKQREARIHKNGGYHTEDEWQERIAMFSHGCAYCQSTDCILTKDHLIPLASGGSNYKENIVPACQSCNQVKNAQDPEVFIRSIKSPQQVSRFLDLIQIASVRRIDTKTPYRKVSDASIRDDVLRLIEENEVLSWRILEDKGRYGVNTYRRHLEVWKDLKEGYWIDERKYRRSGH